jgi:hypothetical protein
VKQIRKRVTYANVMSSIAVFLVLGGGAAYAAKKIGSNEIKSNSITTGKIKKNAVTASKIKGSSITTSKIKDGAVTGPKVNASTLGTVPSATHATSADNATNWSRFYTSGLKKVNGNGTVALGSAGPFSVLGRCTDLGGGTFEARVYLSTSAPGSYMYSPEGDSFSTGGFNPGTEAEIGYGAENSEPEWAGYSGYYSDWTAASPDGTTLLQGFANSGVNAFGANCAFEVHWTSNA